jgi:hypothetical protein
MLLRIIGRGTRESNVEVFGRAKLFGPLRIFVFRSAFVIFAKYIFMNSLLIVLRRVIGCNWLIFSENLFNFFCGEYHVSFELAAWCGVCLVVQYKEFVYFF